MDHAFPELTLSLEHGALLALAGLLALFPVVGLRRTFKRPRFRRHVIFWFFYPVLACLVYAVSPGSLRTNWRVAQATEPLFKTAVVVCLASSVMCATCSEVRARKNESYSSLPTLLAIVVVSCGLVVLLLPTVGTRPASARSECRNNLKQIGLALHNYHSTHNRFPAAQISKSPVSWRVQSLPFLDQEPLWKQYNPRELWDSESNQPVAQTKPRGLQCPSRQRLTLPQTDSLARFYTDYAMLTGSGAFSGPNIARSERVITDGLSNSITVIEATGLNIVWTEPRDANVDELPVGLNQGRKGRIESFGIGSSHHRGFVNTLMSDGSLRTLNENIDRDVLKALTTIQGNEQIINNPDTGQPKLNPPRRFGGI